MNAFNYFSRPYAIACVDDDRDFLELLAMALPSNWNAQYFCKTQTFIDCIQRSTLLAQRDYALLAKVFNSDNSAEHLIIKLLRYWHNNPQRWSICELGILDYAMPKMTGLQVLEALPDWHGKRMLLTGVADERIAVQAFNQSLINQYIAKQSEDIVGRLTAAVENIDFQLYTPYQHLIRTQLNDAQISLLKHESANVALQAFATEHWVEYIVLDNPFGILGLSARGELSWLQLERSCDIDDLKAIAAMEPWDNDVLAAIKQGNVLSNSLLRQAMGGSIAAAIAPIQAFGDDGLIGALFAFEMPLSMKATGNSVSYSEWFNTNSNNVILD